MHKQEYMSVGDVVSITSGFAFKSDLFNDLGNGFPIIRIRDVVRGATKTYYSGDYDEKYIVKAGDYLIGMDGEFNIAKWESEDALLNQRVCKISMDIRKADERYLYYVLIRELKNIEDRTPFVTVKHLSAEDIRSTIVFLPSLETQRRIAGALDQAQALIDLRKQQIALLDELVKSVFLEMFGDPVTNPKGWRKEKLSLLGELNRGVSKHRPRNAPELLGGAYPLLQTGEVSNAGLYIQNYSQTYSELGLKQSKLWKSGTLCITIAANIAKTGIIAFDACFPDSVVGFLPSTRTNSIFIHYWFSFFQRILEIQAPESAQKNINLQILSDLDIIVPPLDLQNQFAAIVEQVEAQKAVMEQSLALMEENFNSIMQKAFRGELFS